MRNFHNLRHMEKGTDMEVKQFIVLLRRWFWLLILGLVLGAASGILISRVQTPVYQAIAKILVMRVPDQSALGLAYLGDQQLAQTFSELITTLPVLDNVSNQLGFKIDPSQIQIQQNTNSQIIKVIVEDNNPQRCAKITNTLVETAIQRYVDLQVGQYVSLEDDIQARLNLIQSRMTSVQSQITETSGTIIKNQLEQIKSQMIPLQNEVSQLQQDIAQLTPDTTPLARANTPEEKALLAEKQSKLAQIQPLLNAYQEAYSNLVVLNKPIDNGNVDVNNLLLLEKTLGTYQQNYIDLMSKLELLKQSHINGISNVTKIQDATVPVSPVRPQVLINTLLTSAVGFILAVIAVLMMENLNITLRFPDKIRKQP
jgi:succinoglycan biosynthesis transport protein ExoP